MPPEPTGHSVGRLTSKNTPAAHCQWRQQQEISSTLDVSERRVKSNVGARFRQARRRGTTVAIDRRARRLLCPD